MYTKEKLLKHLTEDTQVLRHAGVRRAFERVDRKDFVPEELKEEAYEDYPLPIGEGQTISQPTTVAFMLERLDVEEGCTVLDVGSGSGWTTVLLAEMVGPKGSVCGVEILPQLITLCKNNIQKYPYKNISIEQAKINVIGLPEKAPFDRILVSAAAHEEVPQELMGQLAPGGVMVLPVDTDVIEITKELDGSIKQRGYPGFSFVPLVSKI